MEFKATWFDYLQVLIILLIAIIVCLLLGWLKWKVTEIKMETGLLNIKR